MVDEEEEAGLSEPPKRVVKPYMWVKRFASEKKKYAKKTSEVLKSQDFEEVSRLGGSRAKIPPPPPKGGQPHFWVVVAKNLSDSPTQFGSS